MECNDDLALSVIMDIMYCL